MAIALGALGCAPPIPPRPQPRPVPDSTVLVSEFYRRVNAEDLPGVMALMVPEPVVIEPLSHEGRATEHRGYHDVATWFWFGFHYRQDVIELEFVGLEGEGERALVSWSLHAEDGDAFSGVTHIEIDHGLIARVEIQRRD